MLEVDVVEYELLDPLGVVYVMVPVPLPTVTVTSSSPSPWKQIQLFRKPTPLL
jgi:hypothetical protein